MKIYNINIDTKSKFKYCKNSDERNKEFNHHIL